jgi:uridine kinase
MSIQEFLATHHPKNGRFFTIAIDGRGGCGKSTLAELLKTKFPDFVVLNGDDYFEPIDDSTVWGEFNDDRFANDVIEPLKSGNSFIYRPYDWHADPHITERKLEITKGFILERCYSFQFDLDWDLKIWVETPKEVCLERGIVREMMPREKVIPAWKVWQAKEDAYIRDFKPQEKADIVIDGTNPFEEQL